MYNVRVFKDEKWRNRLSMPGQIGPGTQHASNMMLVRFRRDLGAMGRFDKTHIQRHTHSSSVDVSVVRIEVSTVKIVETQLAGNYYIFTVHADTC